MQALNFPTYKFRIKSSENKYAIFDIIRKKYVILNPEEWVRQHFIHYLIDYLIHLIILSLLLIYRQPFQKKIQGLILFFFSKSLCCISDFYAYVISSNALLFPSVFIFLITFG